MIKITPLHLIFGSLLLLFGIIIYNSIAPGKYDEFAQCLTEKNVKMYGAYWCQYCAQQKAMFGKSFRYATYIECTEEEQLCNSKNIRTYPTWEINGSRQLVGLQQLSSLATLSGCSLI